MHMPLNLLPLPLLLCCSELHKSPAHTLLAPHFSSHSCPTPTMTMTNWKIMYTDVSSTCSMQHGMCRARCQGMAAERRSLAPGACHIKAEVQACCEDMAGWLARRATLINCRNRYGVRARQGGEAYAEGCSAEIGMVCPTLSHTFAPSTLTGLEASRNAL